MRIWHNIYLLDHIYKKTRKSSAVTSIIFWMSAQWVPEATNMLWLILFSIDVLLAAAVAHLLQSTNKCFLLGTLTAGTWKPEVAAAELFCYRWGS